MVWTFECEKAFEKLKQYFEEISLPVSPQPSDVLLLHLIVFETTTSSVLVREEGDRVQSPIYYIKKVLVNAIKRYQPIEKYTWIQLWRLGRYTCTYKLTLLEC